MSQFSHHAMATVFEIRIPSGDPDYLAQAAHACFEELDHMESELSKFIETSDVRRVAALQPRAPCPVGVDFFECLKVTMRVYEETKGAFDPSFGKMGLLALQAEALTVWVKEEGVLLDFGGLGKGYALDRMGDILLEWGMTGFLLHAGHSSALAWASGKSQDVSLRDPRDQNSVLSSVPLGGQGLGGSGRSLQGDHILDPRTGKPVRGRLGAWALAPTAALSDAYSTAFMVMKDAEIADLCARKPEISCMLMRDNGEVVTFGNWPKENALPLQRGGEGGDNS